MPKRKALVAQEYWERKITVGETFDVEPQDLELLVKLGRVAESSGSDDDDDDEKKKKYSTVSLDDGAYNNRQMTAVNPPFKTKTKITK